MRATMVGMMVFGLLGFTSCRATVAGDPDRPIKIEAHITLDIRQVKETAASIEDMVSGKAPPSASKPSSSLREFLDPAAFAEPPQLKTTTPEIQKAIDSRRDRFSQLKTYKSQGVIGEDNQGHAAVLGGGPEVAALVDAENRDRETIYKAIVQQNNLVAETIDTIRATFAEVQREKADSGEKIQLPSGQWQTK